MLRDQPWINWIKWLPIELKFTIYNFIDIETRLEMLSPLITDTMRYLYRSKETTTLLHKYEQLIYMRLFTKSNNNYFTKPNFKQLLPPTVFFKTGVQCIHTHPLIKLLKQDLRFSPYTKRMILSSEPGFHYRYHNAVVEQVQYCFNLIPTIISFNDDFDYQIKRLLIRFLHHLINITKTVKETERQHKLLVYERKIRRYYKKHIISRIRVQSNKMQLKIAKTKKIAEKKAKIEAKLFAKTKRLITQNAKSAAKKAKMIKKNANSVKR